MKRPKSSIVVIITGGIVCAALACTVLRNSRAREERLRADVRAALDDYDFVAADQLLEQSRSRTAATELLRAELARRSLPEDFPAAEEHLHLAALSGLSVESGEFVSLLLDCQQHGTSPEMENVLLRRARSNSDDGPLVYEAMVRGFLRIRHFGGAIDCLDRWVADHPRDWRARMWRGAFFEHMTQPELAISDYQAALKARPENWRAKKRLGLVLARTGYDFGSALELLSSGPVVGRADVLVAKALCWRALGEPEKASRLVEKALRIEPDHYRGLQLTALLELDEGRSDAALALVARLESLQSRVDRDAELRRLLRLRPAVFQVHDTQILGETMHLKARALRQSGDFAAAEACALQLRHLQDTGAEIKRLLRQQREHPTDVEIAYRLGVLHADIGFDDSARHWFTRALEVQPGHVQSRAALNKL